MTRTFVNKPTGRPPNTLEDVWRFVDKRGDDECWPWTGACRRRGYGAFTLNRRTIPASRAVYEAATGEAPGDLFVCHSCDNPTCCNPAHLFLGTPTDNVRDMHAKGRANPAAGEEHYCAKLTVSQVREIRERRARGEKLIDLAKEYGVSDSRLSAITRHPDKFWKCAA